MQSQLDKAAGQLSRVQKGVILIISILLISVFFIIFFKNAEKESVQQEMERMRDKHDKNQVMRSVYAKS